MKKLILTVGAICSYFFANAQIEAFRWGGDMVTRSTTKINASIITVDLDGDTIPDKMAITPFDSVNPLSRVFNNGYQTNSIPFYGGMQTGLLNPGSTNPSFADRQISDQGSNDIFNVRSQRNNMQLFMYFKKENFTGAGQATTLSIDSSCSLVADIPRRDNLNVRWVLQQGGEVFVSKLNERTITFGDTNDGLWAKWDPADTLDFDIQGATYMPMEFTDIEGIGLYAENTGGVSDGSRKWLHVRGLVANLRSTIEATLETPTSGLYLKDRSVIASVNVASSAFPISKVDFYSSVSGLITSLSSEPYITPYTPRTAGIDEIYAVVYDNQGDSLITEIAELNVILTTLDVPVMDTTVNEGDAFPVSARTSITGTVDSVVFEFSKRQFESLRLFGGGNDYINIGKGVSTSKSFAIETWVRTGDGSDAVFLGVNPADKSNRLMLRANNNSLNAFLDNGTGVNPIELQGSSNIRNNTWHHVVLSVDGTTNKAEIYFNGVLEDSVTIPDSINSFDATDLWSIGQEFDGNSITGEFNGYLTELRIWNKALDTSAIKANMFTRLTGNESDLAAYYPMNYGYGASRVLDKSGNGNDGVLNSLDKFAIWNYLAPDTLLRDTLIEKVVVTQSPYTSNVTLNKEGRYVLTATSYSNTPAMATSNSRNITVINVAPSVTLAPSSDTTIKEDSSITVTANVSSLSMIGKVVFYVNGEMVAKKTSAPYEYTFTGDSVGVYKIKAVAYDEVGDRGEAEVDVTVDVNVGIESLEEESSVLIYPNPASSVITVKGKELGLVNIVSIQGLIVYSAVVDGDETSIDVSSLASGLYILDVNGTKEELIIE